MKMSEKGSDKKVVVEGTTLKRTGSVSAKASIFEQKSAADEGEMQQKHGDSGKNKLRAKTRDARFCTQPITLDEVNEAKIQNNAGNAASGEMLANRSKEATEMKSSKFPDDGGPKLTLFKDELNDKLKRKSASFRCPGELKMMKGTTNPSDDDEDVGKTIRGRKMSGGTDVLDDVVTSKSTIAQRLAALQKSGQADWRKRISKISPEHDFPASIHVNETQKLLKNELTNGFRAKVLQERKLEEDNNANGGTSGKLADRLGKLENSAQGWKKRVEPTDAAQFSVAGKMSSANPSEKPATPLAKRKPTPAVFKSKSDASEEEKSETVNVGSEKSSRDKFEIIECKKRVEKITAVPVPEICDEDFATFFGKVKDFNEIERLPSDIPELEATRLLSSNKKRVRVRRNHGTRKNPVKALAERTDLKMEYAEVKTNVAEREMKRMNVEKLSKSSNLAVEALAGLASKEDFASVLLKKSDGSPKGEMLPYKNLMLLRVKGRRHVQTRLIQPHPSSINEGDCFVLITPDEVFLYIGEFSNIIERSRAAEIAQHIVSTHDMGCKTAAVVNTITSGVVTKMKEKFWSLLGVSEEEAVRAEASEAGHPDEDEVYESSVIWTNLIYEVSGEELRPVDKYWGVMPKIEILDPNKALVFDFGSELYAWMGKNLDLKSRKAASSLAKELWTRGYDYSECDDANPVGGSASGAARPDWCLLAKVTQHMETVLFREKFSDWPDFTRVIKVKGEDEDGEKENRNHEHKCQGVEAADACDAEGMARWRLPEPDFQLEGCHLGRGREFFDEEMRRFYKVTTHDVRTWLVSEFESELVPDEEKGRFYSGNSYVVRWSYSITFGGRELTGLPSKHSVVGRERCVYFCWQGRKASLNEKGAAALLTVELDKEKGPQVRLSQGQEPPAFVGLFEGGAVFYRGKKGDGRGVGGDLKMFACKGEVEREAALVEVKKSARQLRSRASFALIDARRGNAYVWHGAKASRHTKKSCRFAVAKLCENSPLELRSYDEPLSLVEISEGEEPEEFFKALESSSRKLYHSLLGESGDFNKTPVLFHLSSCSGAFCAVPIVPPQAHADIVTPYPYTQHDLYSAQQPSVFILDTGRELWLWQGWWPERERMENDACAADEPDVGMARGSAHVRWQAERKTAMQTALDYWKEKYGPSEPAKASLVWAGLEPLEFTNLFLEWEDRDDIAKINLTDGRKPGEILAVEQELARLTRSTYPVEQLLQRPLPDGVDPTKLELYLSPTHFMDLLKVSKEEFASLPSWKRTNLKKCAGLF